jgi:hypothetical protein
MTIIKQRKLKITQKVIDKKYENKDQQNDQENIGLVEYLKFRETLQSKRPKNK